MRRLILIVVSVLVSGGFLWLALQGVPLAEVGETITQANPFWIVVSFLCVGLALWARGVRWRGLLDNRISVMQGFHIFSITMLMNQLPLRAGEVVRLLLVTRYGVPIVTSAASVIIERLIDVVTVVLMIAFGLTRLPSAPPAVTNVATLFGAGALVGFIVLILFARFPNLAYRLLDYLEARFKVLTRLGLRKRLGELLDGLRPLTHWRSALHVIVWTVISWGVSLITFYTLQLALGVQGVDLWVMAVLSMSLAALSVAIPVTLASIGPFQGAVRLAGEVLLLNAVTAASLGILFHGITVLGYAVYGGVGLLMLGVSLGDLIKRVDAESPVAAETE